MISINQICKKYKKKTVLEDISFSVKQGECIGILGQNGSGKSTLLSILAGTLSADSGTIDYEEEGNIIGYVPQDNPLIFDLTVRDNLKLWYGKAIPSIVEELRLTEVLSQTVSHLSGGMRKRLSIAIAMAKDPDILILDEPSAALDLPCKQMIRDYLQGFCLKGGTVIIATHDEMELDMCHRLLVIAGGHIKAIPPTLRGAELIEELKSK